MLTVNKVRGEDHPADILTKYIDQGKIHQHCHGMRLVPEIGRPESAPATSIQGQRLAYPDDMFSRMLLIVILRMTTRRSYALFLC